jgi:hypothetical protein
MIDYETPSTPTSPQHRILTLRIIWAFLIIGQLAFAAVLFAVLLPHQTRPRNPNSTLVWINLFMALTMIPGAFAIRRTIFRTRTPAAYATGNILFWSACEGVTFLALVVTLLNGTPRPTLFIAAVALLCQIATFPTRMKLDSLTLRPTP